MLTHHSQRTKQKYVLVLLCPKQRPSRYLPDRSTECRKAQWVRGATFLRLLPRHLLAAPPSLWMRQPSKQPYWQLRPQFCLHSSPGRLDNLLVRAADIMGNAVRKIDYSSAAPQFSYDTNLIRRKSLGRDSNTRRRVKELNVWIDWRRTRCCRWTTLR